MLNNFTIIIPTINQGKYLKNCISSVLSQDYSNYNIVILANGIQKDLFETWLKQFETNKITVYFSESKLSIEENWRRILNVKKHEYFTILGDDDILLKNFLSEINDLINRYPNASLFQTYFNLIDANGSIIRKCRYIPEIESVYGFLKSKFTSQRDSFGTGFVISSDRYASVDGIPLYPKLLFSDDALWVKLIAQSFKATSPKICFEYRYHANSVSFKPKPRDLILSLCMYLEFLVSFSSTNVDTKNVLKKFLKIFISRIFITSLLLIYESANNSDIPLRSIRVKRLKALFKKYQTDISFKDMTYLRYLEIMNMSNVGRIIFKSINQLRFK